MKQGIIHLVDDDPSVREALELLLKLEGYRVACYVSGHQFLQHLPTGDGCVVLDMRLGDMSGQDVLEAMRERGSTLPVIVLTAFGDIPSTVKAVRSGAIDYITKSQNPEVLVSRIQSVLAETNVSPDDRAPNRFAEGLQRLTPRERQVFELAKGGLDTRMISQHLAISPRTIEAHRSHIAKKFQAGSLAEVFRLALNDGT